MGKRIILVLIPLLFLLGIGLAPTLLHVERVRDLVTERLTDQFGESLQIGEIRWHWLPLPRVTLHQTRIIRRQIVISLPETTLHFEWHSLLAGKFRLREIILDSPLVDIKSIPQWESREKIALPVTNIIVRSGKIHFQDDLSLPYLFLHGPTDISITRAEITPTPDWLYFYATGHSSLAEDFHVIGEYNADSKSYHARVSTKNLLHDKKITLAEGRLLPVESETDLTAVIEGTGLESLRIQLNGQFPDFKARQKENEFLFDCGKVDVDLQINKTTVALQINEAELHQPALNLHGRIQRSRAVEDNADPLWHLDLNADGIDLSQVREGILTLLGDNATATKVLNIVRGGWAKTGSYLFDGPVSDFHKLKAMTIGADVLSAEIFVPTAELQLTEAKGVILIKDGILSGSNLSARLGESHGQDCLLRLGLTGEDPPLTLEIDLNADLADLPAILTRLVKHAGFQNELQRIHEVNGSAVGHLSIGDYLHHPQVRVTANNIEAQLQYDRISWPISVQKGTFLYAPGKAEWQKVKALIGPQAIDSVGGNVVWGRENLLTVELGSATIDTAALFAELAGRAALSDTIQKSVAAVEGLAILRDGHLSGPPFEPDKWQYKANGSAERIEWTNPRLPEPVIFNNADFSFSTDSLELTTDSAVFLGRPYVFSGTFEHTLLAHWYGRLTLTGTLNTKAGNWLRRKNWIPPLYFPRIPCTLQDFTVAWNVEGHSANGTIIAGDGEPQQPSATLQITSAPGEIPLKSITFRDQDQKGTFALKRGNSPTDLQIDWEGRLHAETLTALFEKNNLNSGILQGKFHITTASDPHGSFFDGTIDVRNLAWNWTNDKEEQALLDLRGQGQGRLSITELQLTLGRDIVSLEGQVGRTATGLDVQLNLTAAHITREELLAFIADLKDKISKFRPRPLQETAADRFSTLPLTGDIRFTIDNLSINQEITAEDGKRQEIEHVLKAAVGRLELLGRSGFNTHIKSAQLCGINLSGTLYAGDIIGEEGISLTTTETLNFQDVLPCLGIKQDVVVGAFQMHGTLKGKFDYWADGAIDVTSTDGRILRMRLLSKIFSLVNITDIFTTNELSSLNQKGFGYSDLDFEAVILDNRLDIRRAVIRGEGLNLFARGELDLATLDSDITVLIAPLKTIDRLISKVPLIGRAIGGKDVALVAIPVGVKGNITNPDVILLPPQAVGEGILNIVKETLSLPFDILSPILPKEKTPDADSDGN